MRENQWLFERNFSKYSLEHINNANTEAETKHRLELDKSIHGKLASPTQFSILVRSEKPHLFLFTPITHIFEIFSSPCILSSCSFSLLILSKSQVNHQSRVPKELISRFVKICPTCQVRRGGARLTPPSSRRSSPRLEVLSRSPKLPSPPMSRRDSTLNGQLVLERPQSDYFTQFSSHGTWLDSQRSLQERQAISAGHVRSFNGGTMGHLPGTLPGTLDSFHGDMPVSSSQVSYNAGYPSTHGPSSHRDY